jgi:hypothetical protein
MLMPDAPQKDPKTGRFLPGNSGYGGRPKGSRNKLGETFIQALADDFEAHGAKAIQECRKKAPHKYLSVIAQLLPKEAKVEISQDIHVSITEFVRNFRLIREAQEVIGVSPPLLIEAEDDDGQ